MNENYSMIKVLGKGSSGTCYLVEAQTANCVRVIKQIDLRRMSESERDETIREAQILRRLVHPSIIKFRDAYTTKKGKLCIVMDYADGGDFQSKIKDRNGKLFSESHILRWFVQMCLALQHVHDCKILHRDLKAQNVFLTSSGRVKLGDFGISKVLSQTSENAKTMVGTPYYLSPEIIESRPYNFKSDIWSLGVILYEICSLKPPFEAPNLHFLALKIVRGIFTPIPEKYSPQLKALVTRMLSIDPHKRPTLQQIFQEGIIRKAMQGLIAKLMDSNEVSEIFLQNEALFFDKRKKRRRDEEKRRKLVEELKSKRESCRNQEENNQDLLIELGIALLEYKETEDLQTQSYDKIEALRVYLEDTLGADVFIEAYSIVKKFYAEEITYDEYYPYLKNLMSREAQLENIPLIQTLIDMENLC